MIFLIGVFRYYMGWGEQLAMTTSSISMLAGLSDCVDWLGAGKLGGCSQEHLDKYMHAWTINSSA